LRLALHEGNRTRAQLLRARGVAPETVQELCAFRGVCGEPDVEQYDEDIATLGSANSSASDVRCTLRDSGFEDDAINAWFERASELDFVCTEDDYFGAEDETWTSDLSGDRYYGTSDQLKIYTASHDWEYRHESDGQYFWCHGSDRYYDSEIYTESSMPDENSVCAEWAEHAGWYYDGVYWMSERPESEDEENEDEELPWHGIRYWSTVAACNRWEPTFGFEVEMDLDNRLEARANHNDLNNVVIEHDGSLDETIGAEIITRPFSYLELHKDDNPLRTMLRTLKRHHNARVPDRKEMEYGVHITTNVHFLSYDARQRVYAMTQCRALQPLIDFIVRRPQNSYCPRKDFVNEGHWYAINQRNKDLWEFRMFQSTLDWNILLSYVDFIRAVFDYCKVERVFNGPLAASLFRHWVCQEGKYPHLAARLGKHLQTLPAEAYAAGTRREAPVKEPPPKTISQIVAAGDALTRIALGYDVGRPSWFVDESYNLSA
jgi:hypothetical protein